MTNLERLSAVECLRRSRHQLWLQQLRAEVTERLLPSCVVYLFGSRARGDWDGFSDTDLLAVAATQELAEKQADHLRAGLVGDDVIAISIEYWQAIGEKSSPYWRAIKAQAQLLAG